MGAPTVHFGTLDDKFGAQESPFESLHFGAQLSHPIAQECTSRVLEMFRFFVMSTKLELPTRQNCRNVQTYKHINNLKLSKMKNCKKTLTYQNADITTYSYQNYKLVRIANISINPSSYFWCLGRPQTSGLQRAFLRKALQVV